MVKKRRDFEYKLQKRTKNKQDYLKYIQYEINLLTLVRMRRNVCAVLLVFTFDQGYNINVILFLSTENWLLLQKT